MFDLMLKISREKILKYEEVFCLQDDQGRNILHHAVIKQHSDIVKKLIFLDADFSKLRNMKDTKGKTPQQYDDRGLFKEIFETIWDAAKKGNCERLKQLAKSTDIEDKTPWLSNTALHIAVRSKQVKTVKTLVWDLKANVKSVNGMDLTPIDYCRQFIKDEETRTTVMGPLNKMHQNTIVVKNLAIKREKEAKR